MVQARGPSTGFLHDLRTPALVVERQVVTANCRAMLARAARAGVRLRPHLKTAKSASVAKLATGGRDGLTVSTVSEAAYFARSGFRDLTYAVGITPDKLDALAAIGRGTGARISVILDHPATAAAIAARASTLETDVDVLIELDTGGRRGGLEPHSEALMETAAAISSAPGLNLAGVLTHAGHSYHARGRSEIEAIAEDERRGAVSTAARLRAAGHPCPTVSIGSTPTVIGGLNFDGVTEVRPGVYTFFDLTQLCLGVCRVSDIAASVLATVIGHNRAARSLVIDVGALALSKDLSASEFRTDIGYGLVCRPEPSTPPLAGLLVRDVFQEHGLVAVADGTDPDWTAFPIGARLRILPNHVCMTAAAFDLMHAVEPDGTVSETWDRARLWYDDEVA